MITFSALLFSGECFFHHEPKYISRDVICANLCNYKLFTCRSKFRKVLRPLRRMPRSFRPYRKGVLWVNLAAPSAFNRLTRCLGADVLGYVIKCAVCVLRLSEVFGCLPTAAASDAPAMCDWKATYHLLVQFLQIYAEILHNKVSYASYVMIS